MSAHLRSRGIRIFDYTQFAEPLREEIRQHAESLAAEAGLAIEFLQRRNFRKEDRVQEILRVRGDPSWPGPYLLGDGALLLLQALAQQQTHKSYLRRTEAKCLHYYFYFVLADLGLCYLRVPTWAPFRLQFYYNGHHQLAAQLGKAGIGFELVDNVFVRIEDFEQAQRLTDGLRADLLHRTLNQVAQWLCPVVARFKGGYHWSLMQLEYATDIVFRSAADLEPLYGILVRTAIHAVKPEHVVTFLGRRLDKRYQGEIGNDFHTRIEGTRVKHSMGPNSIKMYDKSWAAYCASRPAILTAAVARARI